MRVARRDYGTSDEMMSIVISSPIVGVRLTPYAF